LGKNIASDTIIVPDAILKMKHSIIPKTSVSDAYYSPSSIVGLAISTLKYCQTQYISPVVYLTLKLLPKA